MIFRVKKVVICFHFTIFVVLETTSVERRGTIILLWFAFILLSLSYWKQQIIANVTAKLRCDLLSFYYLCRTGNNALRVGYLCGRVVICFHFTIFVVLETTRLRFRRHGWRLWFAFILLSLSYWKQPWTNTPRWRKRCDLLSFYYLCRTGNNISYCNFIRQGLWFAFILLSLSYWKQPTCASGSARNCCDLLSFYYLCRTGNNTASTWTSASSVVICFHFTIFVVLETTPDWFCPCCFLLWFAFILLSLSYWKQHKRRCHIASRVVICFHFTIFVVLETTHHGAVGTAVELWFAFILLSLSYWKQPFQHGQIRDWVVICFHFTIFVVLETTGCFQTRTSPGLWFAFILLSLSYWKQPIRNWLTCSVCCDLLSFYYLCRTGNNHFCIILLLLLWFAFILLSLSYWKQL